MSDQHHAGYMGCAGDPVVETPNLDRLAEKGLRFTNAYCPSPLCGPSRMSFMTGRHPHEISVWDNQDELASDVPTFAHAFADAGYETVLSGRMHFVGADQRHGFAKRLIGDVSPTAYINAGWQLDKVVGDLVSTCGMILDSIVKSGPGRTGYQAYDEAVTKTTVDWLMESERASERPFLLTVGFITPHCPFVCPPDDFAFYKERVSPGDLPQFEEDLHPRNERLRKNFGVDPPPPLDAQWRTRVAYYGLTTFLDRQIGSVLDALEQSGQADNTIIVYCSDHGEALGEHGLWWKSTFYDASCRIPLIISWPDRFTHGIRSENVSLMDVGPTVLDIVGAGQIPGATGRSFASLIRAEDDWDDTVFAEYVVDTACRMVRSGPWKYNYYHGMPPELFNLEEDPGEKQNLAGKPEYTAIEERLNELALRDWDPESIQRKVDQIHRERPIIADRIRSDRPLEPDPPWFSVPPVNSVDSSIQPLEKG